MAAACELHMIDDIARKLKVPLILIQAAHPKFTSFKEKRAAVEIVGWSEQELGQAIERHAKKNKIIKD